ncbi:hypothetical protein [Nostoc sp.]
MQAMFKRHNQQRTSNGIKLTVLILQEKENQPEEVSNQWMSCETIKLHTGKGAGKGGTRQGAGRKKGSGSKYSENTKAMKVPIRFDGKMSDVVQMIDNLKEFLKNWDKGLRPQPEGHYSARKELARKMLDDLKSVCGVIDKIPQKRRRRLKSYLNQNPPVFS